MSLLHLKKSLFPCISQTTKQRKNRHQVKKESLPCFTLSPERPQKHHLQNPLWKGSQMPKPCPTLCPAATKVLDHAGLPHKGHRVGTALRAGLQLLFFSQASCFVSLTPVLKRNTAVLAGHAQGRKAISEIISAKAS